MKRQKEKGRRKGHGSRKGTKEARGRRKVRWMNSVRAQRALLTELKKKYPERIKELGYRKLYRMIKGGYFKSRAHLEKFVKEVK